MQIMKMGIGKKWNIFRGRVKKKSRSFSRNISENTFRYFTKIVKFVGYIALFLALVVLSMQVFSYAKNFLEEQENRKIENFALLEEMQEMNTKLFTSCQNENMTRRYLMLVDHDCQKFLGTPVFSAEQSSTISEDFLSFFHLFFVEREKFPEIAANLIAESKEDNENKEELENLEEVSDIIPDEKNIRDKEFEALKNNADITKYVESFGYTLNFSSGKIFLTKNNSPEKNLAEISETSFSLLTEDANFPVENFSEMRSRHEKILAQGMSTEIFEEIEKMNLADNGIPETRENILVVGHNEGNTDTMILLSIDHARKKMTMVSLPRDLWISGRRINAFRLQYGHTVFIQQVEKISGQKISYSFVVDMDIFPQLIDGLGGIDFPFDQALIDPTYKTIDDGKKGTLFYGKGTHHLSGIEALRVARSRHTTSDFSRAARQQKILAALRMNISDTKFMELLPLIKVALENIETDITPLSATTLFWKTRDYELRKGSVLSTNNVLKSEMIDVGRGLKAYALLPKKGDWEIIQKFIWREIQK